MLARKKKRDLYCLIFENLQQKCCHTRCKISGEASTVSSSAKKLDGGAVQSKTAVEYQAMERWAFFCLTVFVFWIALIHKATQLDTILVANVSILKSICGVANCTNFGVTNCTIFGPTQSTCQAFLLNSPMHCWWNHF